VSVGVWCRAVVRGRYRSQLLGAALLILGGGAVQVVMLGATEVMATEPGWDLAAVGVGSSWSGGRCNWWWWATVVFVPEVRKMLYARKLRCRGCSVDLFVAGGEGRLVKGVYGGIVGREGWMDPPATAKATMVKGAFCCFPT